MTFTRRYIRIIAMCLAGLLTVFMSIRQMADSACAATLAGSTGSVDVSVDDDELVITYSGSWKSYLSEQIQLSADCGYMGEYSAIVLNTGNNGDSGTYSVRNAWNNEIPGASVTVQNSDKGNYSYGSMTWTIRVPVSTYDSYNVSALTLSWNGQSTSVSLDSPDESTTQTAATEVVTDESTEQATEAVTGESTEQTSESTEQTTQAATTDSTEQTTRDITTETTEEAAEEGSGSAIVVGGGIQIDGYYDDWSGYPQTQITYTSNNKLCNHYGQLAIDGDTLYAHFKMNELYMTSMKIQIWYITINGQQYALQIQPEKNGSVDWDTQVSREVGTHTNLKVFVGYGNNNECDSKVAYTVYNTNYGAEGSQGDEIEFSLSLSRLAELTGISEDSMGTITIYNPNIGSEGVTIAGSSSGAAIPVCVAAGMAFLYVARLRKKKNM